MLYVDYETIKKLNPIAANEEFSNKYWNALSMIRLDELINIVNTIVTIVLRDIATYFPFPNHELNARTGIIVFNQNEILEHKDPSEVIILHELAHHYCKHMQIVNIKQLNGIEEQANIQVKRWIDNYRDYYNILPEEMKAKYYNCRFN